MIRARQRGTRRSSRGRGAAHQRQLESGGVDGDEEAISDVVSAVDGSVPDDNADDDDDDGTSSECSSGDSHPSFREPIVDDTHVTFSPGSLNRFLLCPLCTGYLRDAFTVTECLHTFCKSCIFTYIKTTADCPVCGVDLRPSPFERIRFDRVVQSMVDKVFPEAMEQDRLKEIEFYRSQGMLSTASALEVEYGLCPKPSGRGGESDGAGTQEGSSVRGRTGRDGSSSRAGKKRKRRVLDPSLPVYDDEVVFRLDPHTGALPALKRPIVRTSASVSVRHLQKFIHMKMGVEGRSPEEIEITYKGEVMGKEHSLAYILKTRGIDDEHHQGVEFKYRLRSAAFYAV